MCLLNGTDMEIPEELLKSLKKDFEEWAILRSPADYEFWTSVYVDGGKCYDFEIEANPEVWMEDCYPEPNQPAVVDAGIIDVKAEYFDYHSDDETTPLDGDAVQKYLESCFSVSNYAPWSFHR